MAEVADCLMQVQLEMTGVADRPMRVQLRMAEVT
jgi:hypothetical protein